MATPTDRKYQKSHEWVKLDGSKAYVGISEYAQEELGDIVFVEVTNPGESVTKGDEVATIESVKAASPIYAPVSGTISDANPDLEDQPELVNQKPWDSHLFTIDGADASEVEDLMDAGAYEQFVEQEKEE